MSTPETSLTRQFEFYGESIPGLEPGDLTGWLIVIEGTDGVGRTTHVDHLRSVLEREGYAVAETGLTRSDLAAEGIRRAKEGNTLGSNAYNLFYATDFADRLERQILPALRAGFVMLTDRYIYSLLARAIVRGADADWIKSVYSFALRPDAVYYLRIEVPDLVPRVIMNGGFDYWESGMDLPMGADIYDSFVNYQARVIEELDELSREYGFETLDATRPVEETAHDLAERVLGLLRSKPHKDEDAMATGG
ncbi:MAG: thymidylate kinase [Candidatus Eisenbacteria bacterium]